MVKFAGSSRGCFVRAESEFVADCISHRRLVAGTRMERALPTGLAELLLLVLVASIVALSGLL